MKVLLISYHYSFSDSTGSLRPRAMAKYLPQNGIDVAVLTYRPQRKPVTFDGNIIGVKDITRDTVPLALYYLWRIWQKGLRALGIYRGVLEYWRDTALAHADEIINHVKPDAILASYPSAEAMEIGLALSEKFGLPLISDFRDGLLFEPVEEERLNHHATNLRYSELEAKVISISRLVLTVSEPISAYFRERYSHSNVMTLHNGFDPDDIVPDMHINLPSGIINIVHTGRLGTSEKGRGIDALTKAIQIILARAPELSQKFKLHFVGQLSDEEQNCLKPLVNIGVIKLWGHQPRAKSLGLQRKAEVLLLITAPDKASIATGKLFEYLQANKLILALTRGTEAERIVGATGSGMIVPPDDAEQIAVAIESIIQDKDKLFIKRNNEAIAGYSRLKQMESLASVLKGICCA